MLSGVALDDLSTTASTEGVPDHTYVGTRTASIVTTIPYSATGGCRSVVTGGCRSAATGGCRSAATGRRRRNVHAAPIPKRMYEILTSALMPNSSPATDALA